MQPFVIYELSILQKSVYSLSNQFFTLFMKFDFTYWSAILLIFFVHLMVFAFLSWHRGYTQERLSDKLLGFLLFLCALYIFPWMVGFAGWYDGYNAFYYREVLFYTPFLQGLIISPVLYLYVKSITNAHYTLRKQDYWHFIPGALYNLYALIVVVVDKLIVKKYYLMNGEADPDFDTWYVVLSTLSISIYLVLSIRYYRQYIKFTYHEFSFAEAASLKWLRNFLYAYAGLTVITLLHGLISVVIDLSYIDNWHYYLAFSIISYYIAIHGYSNHNFHLRHLNFAPETLQQYEKEEVIPPLATADSFIDPAQDDDNSPESSISKTTDDAQMWILKRKLELLMTTDKVYLEPELTLTDLAKRLKTNSAVLSRVVNQCFKMNFNDFINEYRIKEVKEQLVNPSTKNLTILAIALDAGFNSKATFNRAFKKFTGQNPTDYLPE